MFVCFSAIFSKITLYFYTNIFMNLTLKHTKAVEDGEIGAYALLILVITRID